MRGTKTKSALWQAAAIAFAVWAVPGSAAEPTSDHQPISIEQALAAGAQANIDLSSARNASRTAQAALRAADTAPNPTLSFNIVSFRPNRIGQLAADRISDDIVRLDFPIERGGKRRARVGAAQAGLVAATADVANTGREVQEQINTAFYGLMAAEHRLALFGAIAESYRTSQVLGERRLKAGAISGGDFARQRVESLRAQSAVAQAQNDRRDAQLSLAVLIGRERDAAALETVGDWPSAPDIQAIDPDRLADRRPDVQAAFARVDQARRQLDGAQALRHPDVTAGLQFENDPNGVGSSIGVGLSFPIPIRNRYRGEVAAAGTGVDQAEALAAKTRSVAVAEIVIARRAVDTTSQRRIEFDTQQLPAARKAAQTAEFSYAQGALALLDLLDARRTLQSVELAAIDARNDEALAIARLRAAEF
ncbi:MAG: TolC family protein, partial [Sphingomonas sp.]|nr:TolC family protein [Sphingomonas sp.]